MIALTTGLIGLRIAALAASYAAAVLRVGFLSALLPLLGIAKGVTRVTGAISAAVPRMRLLGRTMKAVPAASAATVAGMSLVDQAMSKSAKTSKITSDAMIAGMSATRLAQAQASRSMIAGMSAALDEVLPWGRFVALAKADASLGRLGKLIEAEIEGAPLTDWEQAQAALGLTGDKAAGIGVAPFRDHAECGDEMGTLDEIVLDPLGLVASEAL